MTPIFACTGRFARTCDSKNPNKHRGAGNKKISDIRSGGFIMEPFVLRTLGGSWAGHVRKKNTEAIPLPCSFVFFVVKF